jgi:hypothetical protein
MAETTEEVTEDAVEEVEVAKEEMIQAEKHSSSKIRKVSILAFTLVRNTLCSSRKSEDKSKLGNTAATMENAVEEEGVGEVEVNEEAEEEEVGETTMTEGSKDMRQLRLKRTHWHRVATQRRNSA